MPSSTPRTTSKTRIRRRVAAATLATFAIALGAVTFAGTPLPQTTTSAAGTTATTTSETTSSASTSTAQPVSSSTTGQTGSAALTTGTS